MQYTTSIMFGRIKEYELIACLHYSWITWTCMGYELFVNIQVNLLTIKVKGNQALYLILSSS